MNLLVMEVLVLDQDPAGHIEPLRSAEVGRCRYL